MALACLACIVISIRLSMADDLARRPDVNSVRRAVDLAPGSARYRLREAALLEREPSPGNDAAVGRLLEQALHAEPLLAEPWMQLGLFAEMHYHRVPEEMHPPASEAAYLLGQATVFDHTFKPAWTVANFYARHGDYGPEGFWRYARRCLELTEPNAYAPEPVFDLCWRVSDDPATILKRAVPQSPWVRARYVAYLTDLKLPGPAIEAWRTLNASSKTAAEGPSLALCDLLIGQSDVNRAVEVWNGAHGRTLLDPLLDPGQGRSLTDGNLEHEPTGRGFDWTLPRTSGINNRYFNDDREVRIELDGSQPENAELLTQKIPVEPGARYRLRFRYQTTDIAPGSGLAWVPMDAATNAPGTSTCGSLASAEPATGECEFQAGPAQPIVRLALHYGRALGTLRARGTLRISQVRLDRLT